ncbi:hypothetical protein Bca4012_057151 [Brassica carinata]|uniref:Uncharacterized protein n=1 Tax=Brassica carinata TaxID=52824 RepID=A0A8X7W4B2_BRACI|nr:hypothetical protein Bca52824_015248 [Brassica carinata]
MKANPVILESDPLFGVLEENQVGINPNTGRPRIAPEVLGGMRQYLMMAKGEERLIRAERVKDSVPMVIRDLQKGKGIVFGYSAEDPGNRISGQSPQSEKLLAPAIRANPLVGWRPEDQYRGDILAVNSQSSVSSSSASGSTGSRLKSFDLNLSGTSSKKIIIRKDRGRTRGSRKRMLGKKIISKSD